MVEYIAKDPINNMPINNYTGRAYVYAPNREVVANMVADKYSYVYKIVHVYLME